MSDQDGPADFDARFADLAALAFRVGFRITGDRAESEDLAQEALARTSVRWRRVSGHAEAFVARVATNLALDVVRRRGRRPVVSGREGVAAVGGPDRFVAERMELVAMLRRLPRRQREVLVLRYLADLPEQDTAAALGCSVGTVKQHAHRGLSSLRLALADQGGD